MKKIIFLFLLISSQLFSQDLPDMRVQSGFPLNNQVTACALSPDKKWLATGTHTGTLVVWDIGTGRTLWHNHAHVNNLNALAFTPDGLYVVSGGMDNTVRIWDRFGVLQAEIKEHQGGIMNFLVSADGKRVASSAFDMMVMEFEIPSGKLLKKWEMDTKAPNQPGYIGFPYGVSPNGKHVLYRDAVNKKLLILDATGTTIKHSLTGAEITTPKFDFSLDENFLAATGADDVLRIWDLNSGKLMFELPKIIRYYVSFIKFSKDASLIYITLLTGEFQVWNWKTKTKINEFKVPNGIASGVLEDDEKLYLGSLQEVKVYNWKTGKLSRVIRGAASSLSSAMYPLTNDSILVVTRDASFKMWDLMVNDHSTFKIPRLKEITSTSVAKGGQFFATTGLDSQAVIWNTSKQEALKRFKLPGYGYYVAISQDAKEMLAYASNFSIQRYDVASGKSEILVPQHNAYPPTIQYDATGKYAFINRIFKLGQIDLTTKEFKEFEFDGFSYLTSIGVKNEKEIYIGGYGEKISLVELPSGTEKKQIQKFKNGSYIRYTCLLAHPDGNRFFVADNRGNLTLRDENNTILKNFKGHTNTIIHLFLDSNNKRLVSVSEDNSLKLWDVETGKNIVSVVYLDNFKDFVTFTPDGYYMTSRRGTDAVHYYHKGKIYLFDQFDLQYNRPDIVLERIGKSPKDLIEGYKRAYEKRLQKMGFDPNNFENIRTFKVPDLRMLNQPNNYLTIKDKSINIQLEANGGDEVISWIQCWVNGVPVYGVKGKSVKEKNLKKLQETLAIKLTPGKNRIELSVGNVKGIESLKEILEVNCDIPETRPNLHLITVGVSHYRDSKFNLRYASKDSEDITKFYQQNHPAYASVKSYLLIDSLATKEKVLALRDSLKKTKEEDVVLFFISGHGLLDPKLDYYLAMHDIDFNNPADKGLAYTELESILDGIPARQKLLLIDACHSGELDKDEVALETKKESSAGDVTFRDFGNFTVKKKMGANSFDLMKTLFTDIRRSTGATVIAAAGGAEYAMEGAEWNNGVFTYVFLSGLKEKTADLDQNGEVSVSELQDYLGKRVSEVTQGKQTPANRIENISLDFRVW